MTSVRARDGQDGELWGVNPLDTAVAEIGAQAALEALCHSVSQVARAAAGPPSRVHVRFGCASVEVEWAHPAAAPQPAPPADAPAAGPDHHAVCAPLVGTFYRAPEPGAPPFVAVGDTVQAGQQVGIVEAMKLMNPIVADRPGRVVDVLVADAEPVEYGQPLVTLAPPEEE
jgi:acetyl-CoA carboxylase biotin carboxyl carrier protein